MKSLVYYYVYGTLALTAIMMAMIAYWLFRPVTVLVVKNPQAVKVDKQVYQAGDRLIYSLDYCKHEAIPGTISRALVDGIRISYVAFYNNLPKGCGVTNNADLVIPEFVGTGTYHIEATATYRINPLKTVSTTWRSEDFQVVAKEDLTSQVNKNTGDIERISN